MSEVYVISSGESDDDLPYMAGAGEKATSPDESFNIPSNDHSSSPNIDMEPIDNAIKQKSADESLNLSSNDRSSSPNVDMEPVDNDVDQQRAGSQKGKKKSNKGVEKQIKKKKLAAEKLAKKAAVERNKIYLPGECMKYMNVEGHPSLWSRWYMAGVPREVAATGAHVIQTPSLCNPALLVWTRTIPRTLDSEGGQVKLSPLKERCDRAIYVAEVEDLCEMVTKHTLSPHLAEIRQLCDCKLTLVVFNANDYFKKKGKGRGSQNSGRSGQRRETSNSNRTPMTEIEFQLATTDLLVSADCDTLIAKSASELAQAIVQITKANAEAPAKKAKRDCDDQARFYMRGDNKNCVGVDKDGVGVERLWQQMLAILPHSSLDIARAICAQHKSPFDLYESFESAPGADSIAALADVGVCRAAEARARRVGREFARKLHVLFTATDGDQTIQ